MKTYKNLNIKGTVLDKTQLENYLEQIASDHTINVKSDKTTYPIPNLRENFNFIAKVYNLLNEHIKKEIHIHPAGEWLLDNFYIIEENVKMLEREITQKKYVNLPGIANGPYRGFARIYVVASEIVAYTDNKIETESLENLLKAYQNKKSLTMEEIWNIQNFLKIAIIQNIKEICEKIYIAQIQKQKVNSIIERTIENKETTDNKKINTNLNYAEMRYPFIEYMSYRLKKYGKDAYQYLKILEDEVNKTGSTTSEIIKKEHFAIATSKVSIGNAINSMKTISRINFQEIFEKINGVEEILKKDPAQVYEKMSYETKSYYRSVIKELAQKTKISEIYIITKALELAQNSVNSDNQNRKAHIGYYLIAEGKRDLLKKLEINEKDLKTNNQKSRIYVVSFFTVTILLTIIASVYIYLKTNLIMAIISLILLYIPISEIYLQTLNYILIKTSKQKLIPKLNLYSGIPEENATFVVIPTIINSSKKAKQLIKKLEVYYLANKSENIYFAVLGDCTSSKTKDEKIDQEIIKTGKEEIAKLNTKYGQNVDNFPKFHFLYRKRKWCATEKSYLGWERKRGLLTQFNQMLINKTKEDFSFNSILEKPEKIPDIKYIITLDSDTNLTLNSATELIGAMAHILNKPEIVNGTVKQGYGIIQPRIGIDLLSARKSLFTELFAEKGGTDCYTNAISDVYQDNFEEGIFTGKGIYDLQTFHKILGEEIPENTVLSHDLLEGSYLKCGLATDIVLMDGYPSKYNSYMSRAHRWIRGDWQIIRWLFPTIENKEREKKKNPLNTLSRFKIFDNLRRSLVPILAIVLILLNFNTKLTITIGIISVLMPMLLDIINFIVFRKEVSTAKQKTFTRNISSIVTSIVKGVLELSFLPNKAYDALNAITKTLYRLKSKENLLEWTTAEEAEKLSKTDVLSYYKKMFANVIIGIFILFYGNIITTILGTLWIMGPFIAWYISKENPVKDPIKEINEEEKKYLKTIAKKTWGYFSEYINEENNFLPPDNYQIEGKLANRTSSTNIGLGLLTVVSAYDLGFITKEEAINLLEKMIQTIEKLQKWNGHLYNWYNTITLQPLIPRYISTVDSGNFVGYLYVLKQFLESNNNNEKIENLIKTINNIIEETDFSVLYKEETRLFSVGYNIEENKLTDSYYDFLASEARQASLVAIAKRDVPVKHWNSMSRTLTTLNGYKGLISWSGTAFEYLMPNVNINKYPGSLLDESCKFLIMSQEQYVKKFEVPWGISESAYNLKDLNGNYQYKAFGIPWLGLKRGLADDLVIAPYGSILAITEEPQKVVSNLKELEKIGMLGEYGFYESVDYTPSRLKYSKKYEIVKSYMAHHQGLILLSINNLINKNILVKRFHQNPEIEAVDILLQERMPKEVILTKEKKEKIEKLKYIDYENYAQRVYTKITEPISNTNLIANSEYSIFMDEKGNGFSKYKNILINKYKQTSEEEQGIFFYLKNIKNKRIWSSTPLQTSGKPDKINISFTEDSNKIKRIDGSIETITEITVAPEENVEIRRLKIKNIGNIEETIEITSYLEPVLATKEE